VICEFDLDQAVEEQSADPSHSPIDECNIVLISLTSLRMGQYWMAGQREHEDR